MISAMQVHVLVLDDAFDTGLTVILDAFTTANELVASKRVEAERLEVTTVGVRRHVRTGQGFTVPVTAVKGLGRPDFAIVPALAAKMPETLAVALERRDVRDASQQLRDWADAGVTLGAACTGTFLLAATSLLDGLPATTTWWLAPMFRERYPSVLLDESRMLVGSARHITAGAALGHLDLALWLIRQHSPTLAAMTARYMLVDTRPSQAAFMIPDHLAHSDALVERFEAWVRPRLAEGFSIKEAAQAIGSSERTLNRRCQRVLGKSPLAYVQDVRVQQAVHLLQTRNASVEQVAAQVGYEDGVTLRALLRRKIGRGVRELRGSH
jgi:transcriptional regulator GlxA family with amidase domain